MPKTKIVLIGAGSVSFGTGTLCDLFAARDHLEGSTIALVDINAQAVNTMAAVARRLNAAIGEPFVIQATTERRQVLAGAEFVIIAVAVRRNERWQLDFQIPIKHGVKQVLGENGGPGGLFHCMRNIPITLGICRDIEELAPHALVLNFTNPEGRVCLAAARYTELQFVGPAEYFRLDNMGAVAPGYLANIIVLDDLADLRISMVFHRGRPVAREGKPLFPWPQPIDSRVTGSVKIKPFTMEELKLSALSETMPVIEVVPGQIITRKTQTRVKVADGVILPDTERDILKLAVVERHRATGNIGLGLVSGFGLKRGALASSIAHDSHNIIAVGTDDRDIMAAVKAIETMQGGLAAAAEGQMLAGLALPIAGLMAAEPLETVVAKLEKLQKLARDLGCGLLAPFATLSFLALPVIPELRLTDRGLVDVVEFKLIG